MENENENESQNRHPTFLLVRTNFSETRHKAIQSVAKHRKTHTARSSSHPKQTKKKLINMAPVIVHSTLLLQQRLRLPSLPHNIVVVGDEETRRTSPSPSSEEESSSSSASLADEERLRQRVISILTQALDIVEDRA